MTKHLPTEGSKAAAEAIDAALTSTAECSNSDGAAQSPVCQTPRYEHKQSLIKVPDSGYGSTIDSPELSQENGSTSFLKDKAKNIKKSLFPREKKVLKQYSRTLTTIEQARFADLRVLFGYALSELLLRQKRSSAAVEMRIAVMGETETSARPFILVACQKPILKLVKQFFAQKDIKDELSPSNKIWPRFEVLIREQLELFSGHGPITAWTQCDSALNPDPYSKKSILIMMEEGSRFATLGGTLQAKGPDGQIRQYGLTVGHFETALHDSPEESSVEQTGSDSVDVQSESSLESQDQRQNVVDDTLEPGCLRDPFAPDDDDDDDYEIDGWQTSPDAPRVEAQEHQEPTSFGEYVGAVFMHTFTDSMRLKPDNRDWALIELSSQYWAGAFAYSDLPPPPPPISVAKEDSIAAGQLKDVTVARAGACGIRGKLSKQESTIMFGSQGAFADLYTLSGLAAPGLKAGDSGAWVYDSQTCEVYGHVIGQGLFGDVLVMPMHAIVRDIQESLGASGVWLQPLPFEQVVGADSYNVLFPTPYLVGGTSTQATNINHHFDLATQASLIRMYGHELDWSLFTPSQMGSSHNITPTAPVMTSKRQVNDSAYCSPEVTPSNSMNSTPQRTPTASLKRHHPVESEPASKRLRR
ncbi:hypothetical protein PV08_09485 [Exophiala spinifera]|uniref:Uncharacterized protein n=1 Tax=Exophiala spinifera TaxID=91928 RepID=A0A0D2BLZ3_9EURO|nr:uncharacterized protein PV08_09485 [Exophiala spinifera]KIW12209.1 hypothetical protein PV08_09485 [Exophiala spinifera]